MSSPTSVDGNTILVTGGSGGIGAAACLALGAAGARIVVHANSNLARAEEVAAKIVEGGGEAISVAADVRDPDGVAHLFEVTAEFVGSGPLDALVNVAGTYEPKMFVDISVEDWDDMLATNLRAPFLCSQAALPLLLRGKHPRIVNVSSGTADLGTPGMSHYVAAKAGLSGFTRVLARELGADGVRVNCLVPSLVDTETADQYFSAFWDATIAAQAVPRKQQPEDLTDAFMFLCSPASEWVTGQTIHVDGGLVMR